MNSFTSHIYDTHTAVYNLHLKYREYTCMFILTMGTFCWVHLLLHLIENMRNYSE